MHSPLRFAHLAAPLAIEPTSLAAWLTSPCAAWRICVGGVQAGRGRALQVSKARVCTEKVRRGQGRHLLLSLPPATTAVPRPSSAQTAH